MKKLILLLTLLGLSISHAEEKKDIPTFLQEISVTIKADGGEGSGFIVNRKIENVDITFVWTAGHVVDGARKEKEIVDSKTGQKKIEVTFDDVKIVKELRESGRRVGEIVMDAEVLKYSSSSGSGHDLALLMIRKHGFSLVSAEFYLNDDIIPLGSQLFHVGSLLGQEGHNSMTTGILSQTGRILPDVGKHVFDQTTVTAFPGSSGGGVYTIDGKCVGMLSSRDLIRDMIDILENENNNLLEYILAVEKIKDIILKHKKKMAI